MIRTRPVPHVGLYPPSTAHDIRDVIRTVQRVGQNYTLVPFSIKGFGSYRDSKVIYMDIEPSLVLKQLRTELTQELNSALGKANPEYDFHTTIAFKDLGYKFDSIWEYIKAMEQPDIEQYLLRITVLGKRSRIVCEYDLVLKRLLSRRQALSRYWWRRTVDEMRRLQGTEAKEPTSILARAWHYLANIFRL
ncbi:MAG: 2'-5' RNA ligase family protein [Chloroflexi bacterium]|nr:2'-5' RNA ligase family protein [Chloroflexota bacterium]